MEKQWKRALLVTLIMILSSLAGCLDSEDTIDVEPLPGDNIEDNNNTSTTEIQPYGSVMVSTYHVGELVSAVAGEYVTMEYMSQSNIPVHDYDPTVEDIIRLQNSNLFFYHGLNLEPWVDSTLSSLGENAPPSFITHAMPTGQITLDYESMLISDLCEHLSEGPYENTTLLTDDDILSEIHAEHNAHRLSFPIVEDGHDEDGHDEDGHDEDGHDEDGHDEDGHDEDGHDGHNHAEAEKIINNPQQCPLETVISIFHLEEGEHTIEFISEEGNDFNMVALKMNGGHAHHDHGHDEDGHDEDGHDEDGHDEDGHDEHEGVCHNTTTHENYESNESECEAAGHMWIEDDDHDEGVMVCYDMNSHQVNQEHTTETDCEAAGLMWTAAHDGPGDHDGHEGVCHNTTTHENYESNESECEAAGHMWIEDDDSDGHDDPSPQEILDSFDSNNDSKLSWPEFWTAWGEEEHDDHNDTHNETDAHDEHNETDAHDEHEEKALAEAFNESDEDGDGLLDIVELGHFIHSLDDDHDDHNVGYVNIHIEAEGDYGFALPMDVEFYILSDNSHEGHNHDEDGHDEDGHDEDGHDEDGHDEIGAGNDESFTYDPHSWLDPVAFAAQIDVVLEKLVLTFPNGTSKFTENANSYKAQLQDLDNKYESAFGDAGTCFEGGHEKTIVANHNAYSYMAQRYDIEIITVHGLDPEGEPSPADIIEVINHIEENNITVLFVEEYTSQSAVNSIAADTGVTIETLYTMEMSPSDSNDNYITMMNKNLNNLVNGIGC